MFGAEDYQALFTDLGGTAPAAQADSATPAVPSTPEPATQNPEGQATTTPEPEPAKQAEPVSEADANANPEGQPANTNTTIDDENQKQARAFAELRAANNKYAKVFKQLQSAMNVNNEDEVIERLLNAGLNAQARSQNVDPTILKRMNTLEEQNMQMMAERKQQAVLDSFSALQSEFTLTNQEVMSFAKELDASGIDLFNSGVNISTLYKGMHSDAIYAKKLNDEKQKWIAEGATANNAPGVTTTTGKKNNQGKTEINTMGELESLFNSTKI